MPEDHDPFNDPEARHPRARELMSDEDLWDCTEDSAPFGNDEGWTAYYEFREWRERYPTSNLVECLNWILEGRIGEYTGRLLDEGLIAKLAAGDETSSLMGWGFADVFTLDTTLIGTALAQLADEGRIDEEAKPVVRIALRRQLHPAILARWERHADKRRLLLESAARAIEEG